MTTKIFYIIATANYIGNTIQIRKGEIFSVIFGNTYISSSLKECIAEKKSRVKSNLIVVQKFPFDDTQDFEYWNDKEFIKLLNTFFLLVYKKQEIPLDEV